MAHFAPAAARPEHNRRRFLTSAALLPLAVAACRFPRDPEDTLTRVTGDTMRVGALESAPWVSWKGDAPDGVETDLASGFAESLDARPTWYRREESDLHRALADGEIDLLIGNLDADNPWKKHLAFTRPYLEVPVLVFAPDGHALESIDDVPVAVPQASPLAALVADNGGEPVPDGDAATMAAATPAWTVKPDDTGDALVLQTQRHVMAVRKGENAWLLALEEYLERAAGPGLRQRLAEAAA